MKNRRIGGGGGFTLAELLIVMAIIVVLAAIAIPTFGKQLETAREANDAEVIRAAATDAFTQAYAEFATTNEVPTDSFSTAATTGFKQTTVTFDYLKPTITIGGATATLTTIADKTKNASNIAFTFAADGDSIKIATIKIGETALATVE